MRSHCVDFVFRIVMSILFTLRSTVSMSLTLNDGYAWVSLKCSNGNRLIHVSSPVNTTDLLLLASCWMRLSSSMTYELKFELASMKVGSVPLINAFIRCMVVVGGFWIGIGIGIKRTSCFVPKNLHRLWTWKALLLMAPFRSNVRWFWDRNLVNYWS